MIRDLLLIAIGMVLMIISNKVIEFIKDYLEGKKKVYSQELVLTEEQAKKVRELLQAFDQENKDRKGVEE